MNEITTEERLRIVEELNSTANDSLYSESLQRALARITGAEDTSWRGVMRREYFACGGEFAVLALPLIVGVLIYGFEED